jgi:hypothetical protein
LVEVLFCFLHHQELQGEPPDQRWVRQTTLAPITTITITTFTFAITTSTTV